MKKKHRNLSNFLLALVLLTSFGSCAFKSINRSKDIVYLQPGASIKKAQRLNIFAPKKSGVPKDVFIFIHGGNWNSGNRSLYSFFGARLARKDIVAVIINYPLSPAVTYKEMAFATASAVAWTKEHIVDYGGDPNRIFIAGHSAGGHLASLVSLDNSYFDSLGIANPIKGTILIDAAGFTMHDYLTEQQFEQGHTYLETFTNNQQEWIKASPVNFIHKGMPPMLIYQGSKTYQSIKEANEKFVIEVKKIVPGTAFHILEGKKHVPMITQFFRTSNPRYQEIIDFMHAH